MAHAVTAVAPALRALLDGFLDYAGLFPPAKLPLESALANYTQYQAGEYSWILRWFVVGSAALNQVPPSFDGTLSILADGDQTRAASVEAGTTFLASRPVYCEVASGENLDFSQLDLIKQNKNFAKIRAGGLKPEAIPTPAAVAAFILACAERRLPFKATAGLHHPIRAEQPLTYESGSERAIMHGFINVLIASCFAWKGEKNIEAIIAETDASNFSFDDKAHWRDKSVSIAEIIDAREHFIHAVGSCSFEEPVHDLKALGLL